MSEKEGIAGLQQGCSLAVSLSNSSLRYTLNKLQTNEKF